MRRVREILRYRFEEGLGHKAISYRVGAAPSTVRETLRRAEAAGLTNPTARHRKSPLLESKESRTHHAVHNPRTGLISSKLLRPVQERGDQEPQKRLQPPEQEGEL